jgi:Bacterial Ig-like domain (group 3)
MAVARFRVVSLSAPTVGTLIGTIIMRASRFFHRYAAGAFVVAVAVGGALLIGGVANAAPSVSTNQVTATSTALTASPASPVAQGIPVTLTAAVSPAEAAGTVQFKDGTTNLGDPLTVTNGVASVTMSTLAAGSHQLTAVFTPTDSAAFSPSTSPAVSLTVTESGG